MNPDLLRQRRNLIAISAVLLVFDFANVKIMKVSVLGTELLVGNAQVLMVCAWVLWGYFLLRYFQYWWIEPGKPIRDSFDNNLIEYLKLFDQDGQRTDDKCGFFVAFRICHCGFLKWKYAIQRSYPTANDKRHINTGTPISLPFRRTAAWSVKSAAFVCLQTPHVTDHILPFVLAFAAPVVSIFTKLHPHVAEPILTQATRCPFYF